MCFHYDFTRELQYCKQTSTYELQVFATPEAQIGFHPDAGASFYLSRLPGYLGNF